MKIQEQTKILVRNGAKSQNRQHTNVRKIPNVSETTCSPHTSTSESKGFSHPSRANN